MTSEKTEPPTGHILVLSMCQGQRTEKDEDFMDIYKSAVTQREKMKYIVFKSQMILNWFFKNIAIVRS